jgi:hypothetical protein
VPIEGNIAELAMFVVERRKPRRSFSDVAACGGENSDKSRARFVLGRLENRAQHLLLVDAGSARTAPTGRVVLDGAGANWCDRDRPDADSELVRNPFGGTISAVTICGLVLKGDGDAAVFVLAPRERPVDSAGEDLLEAVGARTRTPISHPRVTRP